MNIRITSVLAATAAALILTTTPALATGAPAGPAAPAAMSPTAVKLYLPTTFPDGTSFEHGHFLRDGKIQELPADLTLRGEGVFNGQNEVFKVTGEKHDAVTGEVVVDTSSARAVECQGGNFQFASVDTSNWLANIINGSFNAALGAVNAAEGIAQAAVGASHTPGAKC